MGWMEDTFGLGIDTIDFGSQCKLGYRHKHIIVGYGSNGGRLSYVYGHSPKTTDVRIHMRYLQKKIGALHPCQLDFSENVTMEEPEKDRTDIGVKKRQTRKWDWLAARSETQSLNVFPGGNYRHRRR